MNDIPRQKLQFIMTQYGRALCDDPRRCEAMLKDLCPECKREITVLIGALRENVAKDLLGQSTTLPVEALVSKLARRLYDHLGIAEEFAVWAVESWALALGLTFEPLSVKRTSLYQALDGKMLPNFISSSSQSIPQSLLGTEITQQKQIQREVL